MSPLRVPIYECSRLTSRSRSWRSLRPGTSLPEGFFHLLLVLFNFLLATDDETSTFWPPWWPATSSSSSCCDVGHIGIAMASCGSNASTWSESVSYGPTRSASLSIASGKPDDMHVLHLVLSDFVAEQVARVFWEMRRTSTGSQRGVSTIFVEVEYCKGCWRGVLRSVRLVTWVQW